MYVVVNEKNQGLNGFDQHSGYPEFVTLEKMDTSININIYFSEHDSIVDANMCRRSWSIPAKAILLSEWIEFRK